jgi:hypothetical protein
VPVAKDDSAADGESQRHPHGERVLLRDNEGRGRPFSVTVFVGENDQGSVDVDSAVAFAEAGAPAGSVYQDWGAA